MRRTPIHSVMFHSCRTRRHLLTTGNLVFSSCFGTLGLSESGDWSGGPADNWISLCRPTEPSSSKCCRLQWGVTEQHRHAKLKPTLKGMVQVYLGRFSGVEKCVNRIYQIGGQRPPWYEITNMKSQTLYLITKRSSNQKPQQDRDPGRAKILFDCAKSFESKDSVSWWTELLSPADQTVGTNPQILYLFAVVCSLSHILLISRDVRGLTVDQALDGTQWLPQPDLSQQRSWEDTKAASQRSAAQPAWSCHDVTVWTTTAPTETKTI